MRTRIIGSVAIAALALVACGGDDGGGQNQGEVANMVIDLLNQASDVNSVNVDIDEDCVRDKASELSDSDAQAIVDAGTDSEPDVSAEAGTILDSMFACIDLGDVSVGG